MFAVAQPIPLGEAVPPPDFRRRRRFYSKIPFKVLAVIFGLLVVVLLLPLWAGSFGPDSSGELTAASANQPASAESLSADAYDVADDADMTVAVGSEGRVMSAALYRFGEFYVADSKIPGVDLKVSIDEVRTEGIPVDSAFRTEGQARTCVAIVGSVKLESDGEQQVGPTPVVIPEPSVVADGVTVSPTHGCDPTTLAGEGFVPYNEVSLAPGSTVRWFATFMMTDSAYELVASGPNLYM